MKYFEAHTSESS